MHLILLKSSLLRPLTLECSQLADNGWILNMKGDVRLVRIRAPANHHSKDELSTRL